MFVNIKHVLPRMATNPYRSGIVEGVWAGTQYLGTRTACVSVSSPLSGSCDDSNGSSSHANEVLKQYWDGRPKPTAVSKGKRRRQSGASATPSSQRKLRVLRANGSTKRKPIKMEDDEEEEEIGFDETHIDSMDKYKDVSNWEKLIESVDTIERGSDGVLKVYLTM